MSFRIGRKYAQHVYPTGPGGSGGVSPLAGKWIEVTHAMSPYPAKPGERKFLVNATAGVVEIDLAALPDDAVVIVVDWGGGAGGDSSLNNITVKPPAGGTTIGNPSAAGAQGPLATIASDGADIWWQVVTTSVGRELVQIVGG